MRAPVGGAADASAFPTRRLTEIGGQFRFAREVPGKEDFHDTLRYFRVQLARLGVDVRLGTHVTAAASPWLA